MVIGEEIIYEKKSHADSVDSLCVNGKNIVSASFDGSIKTTNNNETTIIGKHNDWVRKVICTDSNIISASNDGMITIWSDYKKIKSIQAHSWWITDIVLSGDKIVSVSLDETVKVWSYPELKLLYSHKLYGSNKHYSIAVNNGKAFIGSTHGLMSILDISSFEWIESKMIAGTYAILISATKSKKHIIFGSSDGFIIKVMASPPYNMLKEKISNFALKAVAQSEGILYVGDDNGVIRKISIDNIKEPYVLSRFPEAVRALTIDNDLIYAGYDNGHIRIFNKMAKISGKQE